MSPRQVGSQAVSGELRRRVDAVQAATGQGPCPDAVYEEQTVRIPDMRTETRWPTLAQRALEAGAGSMLSRQLYVPGDNLGAATPGSPGERYPPRREARAAIGKRTVRPQTPESWVHDDDLELNDPTAEVTP